MAGSSHNICPNSLALQSDDNAWESGYADVPWSNPSHYSTSSGIAVAHHWDPRDTQVITNMPPAAKSPSSNSMITPPMTQYHTSCLPWSIASPCNYILPDAQNTTRVSNPALGTPMTNTSSLHSSPEESPDSTTCEHTCEHGLTPHPKRQALGVDPNHFGRYKCRWEGCRYTGSFSRENCLWRHIKSFHVSPEEYRCPAQNCKKTFGRKDKFESHWRLYHITHGKGEPCSCHS